MTDITRFDSATTPGVDLIFDDVAISFTVNTVDDGGAPINSDVAFTPALAQRAVELARGTRGGVVELDPDNGLILAIAPDNSMIVTVQKTDGVAQQVALTAAQGETVVGWLKAGLPSVS